MHARVSTYEFPPERRDDVVQVFERAIGPIREMAGIRDAYLLVDAIGGKAMTMTVWESEDALQASAEAANRVRDEATDAYGGTIRSVESYEVALHETF
jgi:heme-degrading monooxygenase HmoA